MNGVTLPVVAKKFIIFSSLETSLLEAFIKALLTVSKLAGVRVGFLGLRGCSLQSFSLKKYDRP
jgi:hypothetical protein